MPPTCPGRTRVWRHMACHTSLCRDITFNLDLVGIIRLAGSLHHTRESSQRKGRPAVGWPGSPGVHFVTTPVHVFPLEVTCTLAPTARGTGVKRCQRSSTSRSLVSSEGESSAPGGLRDHPPPSGVWHGPRWAQINGPTWGGGGHVGPSRYLQARLARLHQTPNEKILVGQSWPV